MRAAQSLHGQVRVAAWQLVCLQQAFHLLQLAICDCKLLTVLFARAGCGRHVEQVMNAIPLDQRCQCAGKEVAVVHSYGLVKTVD